MKTIDRTARPLTTLADLLADPARLQQTEAEQVLTLKEACAFLRVSPDSLYRGRNWKKPGLGYRDPLSGKLRFLKSTLMRYLTHPARGL